MTDKVYVITSGSYSDYQIDRVYLDKAEAEAFVTAHNKVCRGHEMADIEEYPVGVPIDFEGSVYDGPVYVGIWFSSWVTPGWNYSQDVIDHGDVEEDWYTGDDPGESRVMSRSFTPGGVYTNGHPYPASACCRIIGKSKPHVEKVLHDTIARLKAEMAGIA